MSMKLPVPWNRRFARRLRAVEPSAVALWVGAALVAIVLTATAALVMTEHAEVVERETSQAVLLATVLDEQATRSFETASVVMAHLAELGRDAQDAAGLHELQSAMSQALVSLPFIRSLSLLDESGLVVAATYSADVGTRLDLSRLGPPARGKAVIGPWMPGRNLADLGAARTAVAPPGLGMIPYALRLPLRSGKEATLVALLHPDGLLGFQPLSREAEGRVAMLLSYGGAVLASSATDAAVPGPARAVASTDRPAGSGAAAPAAAVLLPGQRLAAHPVFTRELARRSRGTFVGTGASGLQSVIAYQASRAQPLVVLVERPLTLLDADWRERVTPLVAFALLIVTTFAVMTVAARRSLRSREVAQAELRAQLDLTAMILETSPMPVSMLDSRGRYLAVNKAWEDFMWRQRAEVLGRPAADWLSPEEAALHEAQDASLRSGGGTVRYEAGFAHPDGSHRDLLVSKVAVRGASGRRDAVLCVVVDITEFREAERATREARDAAEENARAKSEFISNVSHELRTPLQSIIGFSELGLHAPGVTPRLADMFGHINASGERMLGLVNDLLDMAKQDSGTGGAGYAQTDLRELVNRALSEVGPMLDRAGLHTALSLPERPMTARVDAPRIVQVLLNVLANAIRFSPRGGAITVTGEADEDGHVLTVRDQGPGIPESELALIFEPFVQSSRTRDGSGGTGLGLSICRKIVAAHRGSIGASNAPDGGAVIRIELPCATASGYRSSFMSLPDELRG
jgi:PAS domain S-box-containing protein